MGYRTQDLIFTLFGDYLAAHHNNQVWIGHIIELMTVLDSSAQAVRSTLSRMTRKGWFNSRREGRHSFYTITPKTRALIAEGTQRIYRPRQDPWDNCWYILSYTITEDQRHLRHRLRQRLTWLGFGRLGPSTWISPRNLQNEINQIATSLNIADQLDFFCADYRGFSQPKALVHRCWDMVKLNRAYLDFINRYRPAWRDFVQQNNQSPITARTAFARRFLLVHNYRSFPYVDPNLPPELLPNHWLGDEAIHLFQSYAAALAPQANLYVTEILNVEPGESF